METTANTDEQPPNETNNNDATHIAADNSPTLNPTGSVSEEEVCLMFGATPLHALTTILAYHSIEPQTTGTQRICTYCAFQTVSDSCSCAKGNSTKETRIHLKLIV